MFFPKRGVSKVQLSEYMGVKIDVSEGQLQVCHYRGLVCSWVSERESIHMVGCSWSVCKLNIILLVFSNVYSNTLAYLMQVTIIHEVSVIYDDKDRMLGAFQKIVPMLQAFNDGEQFTVIDRVALFCGRECL